MVALIAFMLYIGWDRAFER